MTAMDDDDGAEIRLIIAQLKVHACTILYHLAQFLPICTVRARRECGSLAPIHSMIRNYEKKNCNSNDVAKL